MGTHLFSRVHFNKCVPFFFVQTRQIQSRIASGSWVSKFRFGYVRFHEFVAQFGGDLERAQARRVIVDLCRDHDLIWGRHFDEVLESFLHHFFRPYHRINERAVDPGFFRRRPVCIYIIERGLQLTRRATKQIGELLL